MIPDLIFVKNTFIQFNSQIFNSSLPAPRFTLTKARTFRGKLCYRVKKSFLRTVNSDFELRISTSFNLPQKEWEDVVIHEMIHLHIASKGIKDTSSHGREFRKMMQFVNATHGRKIRISTKSDPFKEDNPLADKRVKAHFICLAKFSDGRLGMAPVAKTRIFSLWDYFSNFPGVVSLKWIGTTDTWFNGFPHIKNPKFYIVKESDLIPHLKGAAPLMRNGNNIKVVSRRCTPDELLP